MESLRKGPSSSPGCCFSSSSVLVTDASSCLLGSVVPSGVFCVVFVFGGGGGVDESGTEAI